MIAHITGILERKPQNHREHTRGVRAERDVPLWGSDRISCGGAVRDCGVRGVKQTI